MRNTRARPKVPFRTLSTRCKVALMWVKRVSPLYAHLCTNALREVCQYFSIRLQLAICLESKLIVYYPLEAEAEMIDLNREEFSLDCIHPKCVLIDDEQILICGGTKKHSLNKEFVASTFLFEDFQLHSLSRMLYGRVDHGLYYHQESACVFAFGGMSKCREEGKSSEQYEINRNTWSPLPNLRKEKSYVVTCGYQGKVFITGLIDVMEVFTIASKQFTLAEIDFGPFVIIKSLSAWNDKLIVFEMKTVKFYNANTYALETEFPLSKPMWLKSLIVFNDAVFGLDFPQCVSIDLKTMKEKKIFIFNYKFRK